MPTIAFESNQSLGTRAYRGRILHALDENTLAFLPDGGLLVDDRGIIEACDHWNNLQTDARLSSRDIVEVPPHCLITPGFVDMHVHLPQLAVTGCQEADLLSWLETHIFAEEARFADADYAEAASQWFFEELLRNGTTTAAVFLTSHDQATRIAFETTEQLGNRVIMGQNLMDIHAPTALTPNTQQQLAETEAHCIQWHGRDQGRIQYAWVPRFAITSSEDLLSGIGQLRKKYPDVYLHTHLSEQPTEIEAVLHQFPWAIDYTQVYEKFGLLGPKTILAHGIHLSDQELTRIQNAESSLAHCPSSNFFLKSGRFRLMEVLHRHMRFGLGSDVGAGPELCMLKSIKDAQAMQNDELISLPNLFYAATLGAAKALFLDDRIGNLMPGKEADFLILNPSAKPGFSPSPSTPLPEDPNEAQALLSRLIYLGDDRMVVSTFIRGQEVYASQPKNLTSV